MVEKLINALPDNPTIQRLANVALAEYYREHDQPDKAKDYMNKTGFTPENAWSIIGPFDNTGGIGYNEAYIPEDATQIDAAAKYDGVDGQVGWKQQADDTFDGYVDLDKIFGGRSIGSRRMHGQLLPHPMNGKLKSASAAMTKRKFG